MPLAFLNTENLFFLYQSDYMCSPYIFAFSTISYISSLCCWQPQKHHILRDQTLTWSVVGGFQVVTQSSTLLYLHLRLHAALFNFWHFAQKIHFLKPYRLECLYTLDHAAPIITAHEGKVTCMYSIVSSNFPVINKSHPL